MSELPHDQNGEPDRVRLRELTQNTLRDGTYFGRDFELTEHDREQLRGVADKAESVLAPMRSHPDWQTFMQLVEEGSAKGVLVSFTTHQGTAVPTWCVDGGDGAEVKKVLREVAGNGGVLEKAPGIQVPTNIFNLFHWSRTVAKLEEFADTPVEALRGRSTKSLGEALAQMSGFVKQIDQSS